MTDTTKIEWADASTQKTITVREFIAFQLWNRSNPEHIRNSLRPGEELGTVVRPLGDGWTLEQDLTLDWQINRETYLDLADTALDALEHIAAFQEETSRLAPSTSETKQ